MKSFLISILVVSVVVSGCASDGGGVGDRPLTKMESGALLGALGGAVVGAVAYHQNRTKGAVVGAVGGGLAGGAVGAYMDSQRRDLEKNLGREIQAGEARVMGGIHFRSDLNAGWALGRQVASVVWERSGSVPIQ